MSDDIRLPFNADAERVVLGSVLLAPERLLEVLDTLSADDFYREANRRIFGAMVALYGRNVRADLVTLKDELTRRGDLEEAGGPSLPGVPAPKTQQRPGVGSFARDYAGSDAESIAELYRRRDELRAVPQTVKRYLAEGSVEKARTVEGRFPNRLSEERRINQAAEALRDLRAEISRIYAGQALTPREKRDRLERVDERMVQVARHALGKAVLATRIE